MMILRKQVMLTEPHDERGEPMYRLKLGVPIHAVQFTGINAMEVFTLVPKAKWLMLTPHESMKVYFTSRYRDYSFDEVELKRNDWLVLDDAGPMAVTNTMFTTRYERNDHATTDDPAT